MWFVHSAVGVGKYFKGAARVVALVFNQAAGPRGHSYFWQVLCADSSAELRLLPPTRAELFFEVPLRKSEPGAVATGLESEPGAVATGLSAAESVSSCIAAKAAKLFDNNR